MMTKTTSPSRASDRIDRPRGPSEIRLTEHFTVAAAAADVWSVIADYSQDVNWRPAVRSMQQDTQGLVADGTITTECYRLFGRTSTNIGVVHDVQPGHRFRWHTIAGATARGERGVSAVSADLSVIDLELIVTPSGAVEAMLTPLLRLVLRRRLIAEAWHLRCFVEDGVATPQPATLTHPEQKEPQWQTS